MYVTYITYLLATGEILSVRAGDSGDMVLYESGTVGTLEFTGEVASLTHYVLAGVITERPTITASVDKTVLMAMGGDDLATITGVPNGWTYLMPNGQTGATTGTTLTIRAIEVGTFTFSFSNWPYIPYEVTISAINTVL